MSFESHNELWEEICYEMAVEKDAVDASAVQAMKLRYPQFAREITDMAIELALDSQFPKEAEISIQGGDLTLKAMSHVQARLHGILAKQAVVAPKDNLNLFANLPRERLRSLAGNLKANTVFISKLRDRMIDVATMSVGFLNELARELQVNVEQVITYLSAPPSISLGTHYKSEQKPTVGAKQTFREAIENIDLTKEQQEYLLGL